MNYKNYSTWQEVDGKLVPVCEPTKAWAGTPTYQKWLGLLAESLKISLPIIGDISKIKGRKDLVFNKDFHLQCQQKMLQTELWKDCSDDEYDLISDNWRRIVAVLIDNKSEIKTDPEIKEAVKDWCNEMGEINQQKEDVPNTAEKNIKLSQEISGMINELEIQSVKYKRMYTKDVIKLLNHIISKL